MSLATDYAEKAGPSIEIKTEGGNPIFSRTVGHVMVSVNGLPLLHVPGPLFLHEEAAVSFAKDILRVFGDEPIQKEAQ